jgi:hypothetical protein
MDKRETDRDITNNKINRKNNGTEYVLAPDGDSAEGNRLRYERAERASLQCNVM